MNYYSMPEITPEQRKAKIDAMFGRIYQMMQKPAFEPETSNQMEARADRRRDITTSIKLNGGQVRPEYEYGNE